jgi:hypothetical protein
MSQVAFSITIPAMLLASTTKTLTAAHPANLLAIPAIAIAQISLGALMGRWAAAAVQGRCEHSIPGVGDCAFVLRCEETVQTCWLYGHCHSMCYVWTEGCSLHFSKE